MNVRRLGNSGLYVSPICLGTMMFGDRTDEKTAGRIVAKARESGINFIDTADAYSQGGSEVMTGKLLKKDRNSWVLATKAGNAMGAGANMTGLGRKWLMQAIDDSLTRLDTDYVDIFYLHKPDHGTPLEETLGAVGDIIAGGKARYFGISNFRGWEHANIARLCEAMGMAGPIVSQPYYNAMNRVPEVDVLPACAHFRLGVVPYSPLARGVLTGKYLLGEEAKGESRVARQDKRMMETEFRRESLEHAQRIKARAEARGMTSGQFALNWVLANPLVTSVLAGPRTLAQWDEYLGALAHKLTPEDEEFVDSMVTPGHASTYGYNDPSYPLTGRPIG